MAEISIHSPYTGRDAFHGRVYRGQGISIHSPYTGRDAPINVWCKKMEDFNPLSLYRERQMEIKAQGALGRFQSTLPIQGETASYDTQIEMLKSFQSTLPIQGETLSAMHLL